MERENAWLKYGGPEEKELMELGEDYRKFISEAKTERECVKKAVELAEAAGYRKLEDLIASGEKLTAGSRI